MSDIRRVLGEDGPASNEMEVDVTVEEPRPGVVGLRRFVSSYDRHTDSKDEDEKTRSGLTTKRIVTLSPARPILTVSRMTGFA